MDKKIKAAVIGGSGFTGLELIKILSNHRFVKIFVVTSNTYKGLKVGDAFPSFINKNKKSIKDKMIFIATDEVAKNDLCQADVVFICLPPLESMAFIKKHLIQFKGVIIDIGSDFRLKDVDDFKFWYGKDHELKEILPYFVYGLPEIYRENIVKSRRVANPGCYPTSVILALAPILMDSGLDVSSIVIDAKSGVSGAGRKLKYEYLYCGINENFYAYSASMHRHTGEIEQEIKLLSGSRIKVCFTPHLLPVSRGIFTSIYCRVNSKGTEAITKSRIFNIYDEFYGNTVFVEFLGEKVPQLKDVTGTNHCQIGLTYDARTEVLKIFSTIDNLLKGAAGQAVQNMNLIFKFDEGEALHGQGIFS